MKTIVTAHAPITTWVAAGIAACITSLGCLNGEAEDSPSDGKGQQALAATASTSVEDLCRSLMQRQRTCSDSFIPALVAARVESDNPPGVAAQDRALGRAALLEEAFEEWASDSRDSAIDGLCAQIAQTISPSRQVELRESSSACLAKPECEAFVACAVPLSLVHWKE
jgi:hypothetical protein